MADLLYVGRDSEAPGTGRCGDRRLPLKRDAMEISETIGAIHPGEVIREEFLVPLGKTAYWLAKGLGISQTAVGEILQGKRAITPATALRLERFLGCSAEFWLGLQASFDLEEERGRLGPGLA